MREKKKKEIKNRLDTFLKCEETIKIMDGCEIEERATWLNSQINLRITQSSRDHIVIEISNNSNDGITTFKQTYQL